MDKRKLHGMASDLLGIAYIVYHSIAWTLASTGFIDVKFKNKLNIS